MDINERLASLSEQDRRIVQDRLRRLAVREASVTPIDRAGGAVPLSFTQERMWFLEQFQPGLPVHVMSGAARLPVRIEPAVFAECLDEVVDRHEALRTRFTIEDGEPVAVVDSTVHIPLTVMSGVSHDEMWRRFEVEARLPFDIAVGPLVRASIAWTDDGACYAQVTLHHMVSDGYSTGILFGELGALCAGRFINSRPILRPLPYQYADYAAWERRQVTRAEFTTGLAYWVEHLDGAAQRLELPTDRPRPARMTYRGARRTFTISAAKYAAIREWSRQAGVTPFTAMLGVYAIVLARFTRQEDIVIGVPVAHRDQPGSDMVIGPLLNTMALRFDLGGDPAAAEMVTRVNDCVLAAHEHQQIPFERVLGAVRTVRDPSRSPLFQAVFNFQSDRSSIADAPDIELTDLHNGCAQFDLLMNLVTGEHEIAGIVDYYSDVYDASTIDVIIDAYVAAVDALVADASQPISELPLTSLTGVPMFERVSDGLSALSLHDAALALADESKDKIALSAADRSLSYGELEQETGQLAQRLRSSLLAPTGSYVAVCLPRSIDMIIAVLAVSRAGYAYIPLDPDYPADRLAFICDDAEIAGVISRVDLRSSLPPLDVPHLDLDDLDDSTGAADGLAQSTLPPSDPDRDAYMIYTSGSTGTPKGVRVTHRNVVSFLEAMRVEPGIGSDDILLAVTSPSFDIALLEMVLPLTVGGRVVVADSEDVVDGRRLASLIERHDVTMMQATPTTWHLLVVSGWSGSDIFVALCGGEALPVALARKLLDRCGQLWNMYGPTETTIWSTVHRVQPADARNGLIPIGHAIRGTGIVILDPAHRTVPDGVYGELCITGAGVTPGYHERPTLQADRFIPMPGLTGLGYRTGDLVRRRSDGRIEFGGRLDHQVKVRGFRIELGEIEAALEAVGGVSRSVAGTFMREESTTLIAAAEPSPGADVDAQQLKQALREALPEHMIPSRLAIIGQLPLTPNGKVDRARAISLALRALDELDAEVLPGRVHVAATTELERVLASIWQDLLGLTEPPSVQDDFFELGGHSLLATKLVFRIRDALMVDLPLPVLFGVKVTIARLATVLESGAGSETPEQSSMVDLASEARLRPDIRPQPGAHVHSVRHPQHAFVTGASGFVGAFLLAEVLRSTEAKAYCLVRAASVPAGLDRLRAALESYGVWEDGFADRILPVLGDLSQKDLGLSRPNWQHLAAMVDVIYHCGAEVNFLLPYQSLRPANVVGTEYVVRLACDGSVKPIHFVSTTYVFSRFSYPPGTVFTEDMEPVHDLQNTFGYTQSKWVSEHLIREAGRRGVPTWIYRVGRVAGHSVSGACQTYDFVWQATKVGIEMGVAPVMDMTVDITPVDYVVGAIGRLSRRPELRGKIFHVVSKEPLPEPSLVEWMENYGYRGQRTNFDSWCRQVVERAATLDDETAGALAPFLSGTLPLDRIPSARFDTSNVENALGTSEITCPPIDDRLLRTYFDWFISAGYLPDPDHAGSAAVTA